MTIPLINKTDYFEQIRDKIATILATNTALQQALAVIGSLDPAPYKFRVYAERSNPWDVFLNEEDDLSAVANVYFDSTNFDLNRSNLSTRQTTTSRINVDIFAYAETEETQAGHDPGDEAASRNVQAAARQVRNILMHDDNTYLGLQGVVSKRWVSSITAFMMPTATPAIQKIKGVRLAVDVDHNETVSQEDEVICEIVNVKIYTAIDGQIMAEIEIDETPT